MLFRPEAYEPLTEASWDADRVRAAIRAIAADADAAYGGEELWPAEEWDAWQAAVPLKTLYVGAAGVVWALAELRPRAHAESRLDLEAAARRALDAWRAEPDLQRGVELPRPSGSGLLTGETGILLVLHGLAPDPVLADALFERVQANAENPADDLMWGSPGTLLAAAAMLRRSGEQRWRDAWLESAAALLRRRDGDGSWTQRLYGEEYRGLGPVHGAAGNVAALLAAGLLDDERAAALRRETAALLAGAAVVEDGLANWPYALGRGLVAADGELRLQWCAGAPGIVAIAGSFLDEELVLAGAGLVWRAGPPVLDKGSSICHGTAGNGYALLSAFARTRDELWLDRARRFAVHALEQVERARAARDRGRYSLWTGDLGVALYAADCLDARTAYPFIETVR